MFVTNIQNVKTRLEVINALVSMVIEVMEHFALILTNVSKMCLYVITAVYVKIFSALFHANVNRVL